MNKFSSTYDIDCHLLHLTPKLYCEYERHYGIIIAVELSADHNRFYTYRNDMKFPVMFISYQDKYSVQNYEKLNTTFSAGKKGKVALCLTN
jgi:hypothetical protein